MSLAIAKQNAKAQLWRRGILSWKFHSGQDVIEQAYRKTEGKLFVCTISRRFGKSYWGVCKALEKSIQKPNSRIKIATAFQKDLEEFILPAFDIILQDCPQDLRPTYSSSKKKYVFKNKAEIQLVGLDKHPDGGRGNYCDLYICDEAAFISRLSYLYGSVVLPMLINRDDAKVIMISTIPVTPDHDFKSFCDKAQSEKAFVKLTIYDNPLISPATAEEYHNECLSESDWQREFLCEWTTDINRVIIPEWQESLVQEPSPPDTFHFLHKYVAMDLGVKDFTAVIFGYYNFTKAQLVIQDEITLNGPTLTTELLKNEIVKKELALWDAKPYRRISDNNNLMLLQDLGSLHGMHFVATNKDTLEAMVNELRCFIGQGRLVVSPKCTQLIGCLKYGVYDAPRKQFDRSKVYGHYDHLAALIYLVRNLDSHNNPIPNDYGFDRRSSVIKSSSLNNRSLETLQKIFGR